MGHMFSDGQWDAQSSRPRTLCVCLCCCELSVSYGRGSGQRGGSVVLCPPTTRHQNPHPNPHPTHTQTYTHPHRCTCLWCSEGSGYYIAAKAVKLAFRNRDGYSTYKDGDRVPPSAAIATGIIKKYFEVW